MIKVEAQYLQLGDVLKGTGEQVEWGPSSGVRTPSGKVELLLKKGDRSRRVSYNKRTIIVVERQ